MHHRRRFRPGPVVLPPIVECAFLALPHRLAAQHQWTGFDTAWSITLEVMLVRSHEEAYANYGIATGGYFLSARLPLERNLRLAVELPVAAYDRTFRSATYSHRELETVVGNPFIGCLCDIRALGSVTFDFGFRPPLADGTKLGALQAGSVADVQRYGAFVPRSWIVRGLVRYRYALGHLSIVVRAGTIARYPTGTTTASRRDEAVLTYDAALGFDGLHFHAAAGFAGLYWLTYQGPASDRDLHAFDAHVAVKLRGVVPGILVRIPLSDAYGDTAYILGFTVDIAF